MNSEKASESPLHLEIPTSAGDIARLREIAAKQTISTEDLFRLIQSLIQPTLRERPLRTSSDLPFQL